MGAWVSAASAGTEAVNGVVHVFDMRAPVACRAKIQILLEDGPPKVYPGLAFKAHREVVNVNVFAHLHGIMIANMTNKASRQHTVCVCVWVYVHRYTYMYIYIYTHTYTYIRRYASLHV